MNLHEQYQVPRNPKCPLCHRKTASGFDNVTELPPVSGTAKGWPGSTDIVKMPLTCEHCKGTFVFDLLLIPLVKS